MQVVVSPTLHTWWEYFRTMHAGAHGTIRIHSCGCGQEFHNDIMGQTAMKGSTYLEFAAKISCNIKCCSICPPIWGVVYYIMPLPSLRHVVQAYDDTNLRRI